MALNTRTLGEVQDYVKRQFGDESGVQVTDEDIARWVNQATVEIVKTNEVLRASATTTAVNALEKYDIPEDSIKITAIKFGTHLLRRVGFDQYLSKFADSGGPSSCEYWTLYANEVYIGAAPQDSTTVITIFYIPLPETVSFPVDILPIPDVYYDNICQYVMAKAYELDEDWQGHQVQRQLFEDKLHTQSFSEEDTTGPMPVVIDVYGGEEYCAW